MKPPTKKHKQLIMIRSRNDSPWSIVNFVKIIELIGAEADELVSIEVHDDTRNSRAPSYTFKGPGRHNVNVPRGFLRIKRLKGNNPLTVYAHCER